MARLAFVVLMWWSAIVVGVRISVLVMAASAGTRSVAESEAQDGAMYLGAGVFGTIMTQTVRWFLPPLPAAQPSPRPLTWVWDPASEARQSLVGHATSALAAWAWQAVRGAR